MPPSPPPASRLRALASNGAVLDLALWAWLAAVIVWTHTLRLTAFFNWDSQLFLNMGRWVSRGVVPYREAMEVKPPGIFLYFAALFSASPTAWAIRLADVVWALAGAWALVRLLRQPAGRFAAAAAATAWIYWHHHAWLDHGGVYTEHYAALAGLIALACRGPLASGWWTAAAALFKHPGAAVAAAIVIHRWPSWRWRDYGWWLLAIAAPIAAVLLWLWLADAWEGFLYANLWILIRHGRFESLPLNARLLELWQSQIEVAQHYPAMAAGIVLGLIATLFTRTSLALAATVWWLVAVAGVALQGRYFEHHYLLFLPPAALLGGLGLGWLVRLRPAEPWPARLARAALAGVALWWGVGIVARAELGERREVFRQRWAQVVAGPSAWPTGPAGRFESAVGDYINTHTAADQRIHVQGFNPTLLNIYWYAQRPPAAPLFYEVPFVLDRALQFEQIVAGDPAYVIFDRSVYLDPAILAWLERDYQLEASFGETYVVDLWRRRRDLADGAAPQLEFHPVTNPLADPTGGWTSATRLGSYPTMGR